MLWLYRCLTVLITPFLFFYLRKRRARGKEHPTRHRERWGRASLPRPAGPLIWLHAASVGETQAALPLIHRLLDALPDTRLLLTSGTVTSAEIAAAKLPPRAFHQFVPVDTWPAARRFLRHWQPDLAIWTESEFWPNLITLTAETGCPLALVNARMSEKSAVNWQWLPDVIRQLLGCFSLVCAQSPEDAARLVSLGARNVQMLGNLKQDADELPDEPAVRMALERQIGPRPLWLAASTHDGEEREIAAVHEALKADFPDLLTVIVPRHPLRGEKIAAELQGKGLTIALRSLSQPITAAVDVYLADTIGELGVFYRLSDVVFMGGSLIPHGGQNPLEPARLHCALLVGIHTHNFASIYARMEHEQAVIRVATVQALTDHIRHLLHDDAARSTQVQAAFDYASGQQGALSAVLNALRPLVSWQEDAA